MLDGVTPFPAEFAARYRERGYWQDRPLFDGFRDCLREHADRLPPYQRPRWLHPVDTLLRTPTGKLVRRRLRDLHATLAA